MATRKPSDTVGPDADDLDGQVSAIGQSSGENGNDDSNRTIDGQPVTTIEGLTGDEFARDGDGNLIRNKDGSPRKKRGRKAGSGSGSNSKQNGKRNNQTVNDAVETLSKTLLIVHAGLANFMKFEYMALDENECNDLSSSIVNVMDQFEFTPDPRYTAVVGLISTASMIYAPRYILYRNMQRNKKKKTDKPVTENNIADFQVFPSGQNGLK